ncbi:MAG: NADH-quinone oxidoreductase subunit F [Ardenticatenia bacterium]|nr:MAG: NADH-quinone oxidoreductase subunit F [Ardenticatenia bacterium]
MNTHKDLTTAPVVASGDTNVISHRWIAVCMGTGCTSAASAEVRQALIDEITARGLEHQVEVRRTGCFGFCAKGPIVVMHPDGTFYTHVEATDAKEIVEEHILAGRKVERLMYHDPVSNIPIEKWHDIGFYSKQQRILLRNCGLIDPENVHHYIARDGYRALRKVLTEMSPEQVIEEVVRSGLRGRGGGGFPTGVKWKLARQTPQWPKYVICNADEGDPGAFMDRSLLEGDPHSVIEGMIIAAYAIGARYGYIYCRAEYPLAIRRLQIALEQARQLGLLGEHILGSDFSFDLYIKEGAGAFVCGEETALMASIQGERGQPWPRPPYPVVSGLWGQPSNVNNVKSYAYVPSIILQGAEWFQSIGTPGNPGTAVFALTGMVNNTGLIEVPMGITLREIIYEIGGGIPNGRKFKAVQTGGPLGGCLPEAYLDTPVDFDSLCAAGAVMGSGGMIVADETTCMVEFAKYFMKFACDESCGKCPPCRIGSMRMLETLECITAGMGTLEDLDYLRYLANGMQKGSLCALGQLAPAPVMSALRHFEDEFRAHIEERRCPAGKCRALITYEIVADLCTGCMVCARNCPSNAIKGEKRQPHVIDSELCERCGLCIEVCKFNAITVR